MRLHLWLLAAAAIPGRVSDAQEIAPPLRALEAAARTDSLDPIAHYQLALGYLRERRHTEAETALRRAIGLDPKFAPARLGLAVVQDRHENYWRELKRQGGDSAVITELRSRNAELRRAFMLDPLVDIRVLGFADRRRMDLPPAIATGNYMGANFVMSTVERQLIGRRGRTIDSLSPGFLWMHGLVSAHAGVFGHAIVDLNASLRGLLRLEQADSVSPFPLPTNEVRYLLAAVHQRSGNRAQAIALYREVAEHDLGNWMAFVQLARLHEAGEEWSQAITARRSAINSNPEDPTLQLDLAASYLNGRFPARAESLLMDHEAVLATDPRLHYLLGRTRQVLGKRELALASLRRFLEIAPTRWEAAILDARNRIDSLTVAR